MNIPCPKCKQLLEIPEGIERVQCPSCGEVFSVPGQNQPIKKKKGCSTPILILCIVLVLIILGPLFLAICAGGLLLPALNRPREDARRISCQSNLKQISIALRMYVWDYSDRFPHLSGADGLELIRKNGYLADYGIFCCPSTETVRGKGNTPLTYGALANVDYAFAGGMMEGNSPLFGNPESAMASDIYSADISGTNEGKPNHSDYGNMLFHDGHVSAFTGANWYSKENRGSSYMYPNVGN